MIKTQDYKGLKPEQYQQLLIEKEQLVARREEQIRQLEIEHEENQKTIAGLCARKAYLDEIKEQNNRFFRRKSLF
ncbi:MAG TPA: hypothetical protein VK609_22240 [Mucilaginibacter sp.]|nr:hypothetical protein [Mucilaginibacter sp.]